MVSLGKSVTFSNLNYFIFKIEISISHLTGCYGMLFVKDLA